eukprot:9469498-Pyramimonas_sp.AAC.1
MGRFGERPAQLNSIQLNSTPPPPPVPSSSYSSSPHGRLGAGWVGRDASVGGVAAVLIRLALDVAVVVVDHEVRNRLAVLLPHRVAQDGEHLGAEDAGEGAASSRAAALRLPGFLVAG